MNTEQLHAISLVKATAFRNAYAENADNTQELLDDYIESRRAIERDPKYRARYGANEAFRATQRA